MGEWPSVRLGDVIELQRGFDLPSQSRRAGGVPIVSSGGVSGHHADARVEGPGVVTGRYGTLGEVFYLTRPFWPLNTTLFVRDFKGNDPRFVSYLLKGVDFLAYSDKAAVPGVNRNHVHEALVRVPPLGEQQRIAGILGALDDRIELNRALDATEGAVIAAVFDRWFLSRARSSPVPGQQDGLLGDHLEVTRGLSYMGAGLAASGMPLHNLNSIREGGGYKPEGIKWYAGEFAERHVVRPGDLIVTNTEQGHDRLLIGHAAVIPDDFGAVGLYSHHLYRVRIKPGSPLTPDFVCYLLNSRAMHDLVSGFSNGTTVQMLPIEALLRPAFAVPPTALLRAFTELAILERKRQEVRRREGVTLGGVRDTLLPRLLSGELEVTA